MIEEKDMLGIAEKFLERMTASQSDILVIIPQLTIEKPYGNIYYFNYQKFLETGDFNYSAFGGGPFLVEKEKGRVVQFGNAIPLEDEINAYENGTMRTALDTYWYPDEDRFSHK